MLQTASACTVYYRGDLPAVEVYGSQHCPIQHCSGMKVGPSREQGREGVEGLESSGLGLEPE